jgi:predicted transcriptional regulator
MRITIRLDPETKAKLEELQRRKGFLTISETLRYVISEFFENEGERNG